MTRRLEGRKFYTAFNNGVTALISEDGFNDERRYYKIERELMKDRSIVTADLPAIQAGLAHFALPCFVFVSVERFERSPWLTGDVFTQNALTDYIQSEGGTVEYRGFFVPFSNGHEKHGGAGQANELKKVATYGDFRNTFGIGLDEIEARATVAREAYKNLPRLNAGNF